MPHRMWSSWPANVSLRVAVGRSQIFTVRSSEAEMRVVFAFSRPNWAWCTGLAATVRVTRVGERSRRELEEEEEATADEEEEEERAGGGGEQIACEY